MLACLPTAYPNVVKSTRQRQTCGGLAAAVADTSAFHILVLSFAVVAVVELVAKFVVGSAELLAVAAAALIFRQKSQFSLSVIRAMFALAMNQKYHFQYQHFSFLEVYFGHLILLWTFFLKKAKMTSKNPFHQKNCLLFLYHLNHQQCLQLKINEIK